MFARLLAACCLIHLVVVPVWSSSPEESDSTVLVYLTSYVAQAQHPLDYMKLELGHVMATAGYRIQWDDAWSGSRMRGFPSTSSTLVVVELRGSCAIPAGNIASGHPTARRRSWRPPRSPMVRFCRSVGWIVQA